MILVLMGVSGAGKSTVGIELAASLGLPFIEGDAHHPPANVEKMRAGIPLDDQDRRPWLDALGRAIAEAGDAVVACSALKESYRAALRRHAPNAVFVHLSGSRATIAERLSKRQGHYMPAALLDSQLAALEQPRDAIVVAIDASPDVVVARIRDEIARRGLSGAGAKSSPELRHPRSAEG